MNFSYEELYAMYGRYDTNIHIQFIPGSKSYDVFGNNLMGDIIYAKEEREELEEVIKMSPVPRSDKQLRLLPSPAFMLTKDQYEHAERYGVPCSDIYEISSYNKPRVNEFAVKGERTLPAPRIIKMNVRRGDGNRLGFGFLNSRVSRNEQLAPDEVNEYIGFANYFSIDIAKAPFSNMHYEVKRARFYELQAKYHDISMDEHEVKEFAGLIIDRYNEKEDLIKAEIERCGESLKKVADEYKDEIKNLKGACHRFEEKILLFGSKLVYLDVERFLHIYARHVTEVKVGGSFLGKSVFQYKYDDILQVITMVIESQATEIDEHFKSNPNSNFRRSGKRAVYLYGNYYHIEVEASGRLLTFYPYENRTAAEKDSE